MNVELKNLMDIINSNGHCERFYYCATCLIQEECRNFIRITGIFNTGITTEVLNGRYNLAVEYVNKLTEEELFEGLL